MSLKEGKVVAMAARRGYQSQASALDSKSSDVQSLQRSKLSPHVITNEDLLHHSSYYTKPLSLSFRDFRVKYFIQK